MVYLHVSSTKDTNWLFITSYAYDPDYYICVDTSFLLWLGKRLLLFPSCRSNIKIKLCGISISSIQMVNVCTGLCCFIFSLIFVFVTHGEIWKICLNKHIIYNFIIFMYNFQLNCISKHEYVTYRSHQHCLKQFGRCW